jgi:hypothetical protein
MGFAVGSLCSLRNLLLGQPVGQISHPDPISGKVYTRTRSAGVFCLVFLPLPELLYQFSVYRVGEKEILKGGNMPIKGVVKYRWKTNKDGSKTRLAFNRSGKVLEVKQGKRGKPKRVA